MGELDHDACLEFLKELVLKEGKTVYSLFWDSGGPGGGAGSEAIIKFKHLYWTCTEYTGFSGPYDALEYALSSEFTTVTSATQSINSSELSIAEIVELLEPFDIDYTKRLVINGRDWVITTDGEFMRKSTFLKKSGKLVRLYE
jgi:hypothetical protein